MPVYPTKRDDLRRDAALMVRYDAMRKARWALAPSVRAELRASWVRDCARIRNGLSERFWLRPRFYPRRRPALVS
jgi:hypothetical protein